MRLISNTRDDDGVCVLALGGEIDLQFAPVLRTVLEEKGSGRCGALVLDLSEVTFIDSSGIAAIIGHLREAAQSRSRFCIGGVSETVEGIIEVICLRKAMSVFRTRAEALKAMRQREIAEPEKPLFSTRDPDAPSASV